MSYSSLTNVYIPSPYHSGHRQATIKGVAIHCTAGKTTAEQLGKWFQSEGLNASSNYGIGYDGSIGCYVDEENRSWCTSSGTVDNSVITIEVSTENVPPYKCTDASYRSLIQLLVDICKRYGLTLKWKNDMGLLYNWAEQNMVVHRWLAAKECPGEYLLNLHGKIASEVNIRVKGETATAKQPEDEEYEKWKKYYEQFRRENSVYPEWATQEAAQAIKDGITDGDRPLAPINRCEASLMIYRAVKKYLSKFTKQEDDCK